MSELDLSRLAPPDVVEEIDYEQIRDAILEDLAGRVDQSIVDLESEPLVKLAEAAAYREMLIRQRANDVARAVMLPTAQGADLDNLTALLGVVRKDGESDDELRHRASGALEGFPTAGPARSYAFHARSASSNVKDVAVYSPSAGVVEVAILGVNGDGTPDQDTLDTVSTELNDERVRPLTDTVQVVPASIQTYAIEATLYVAPEPDQDVVKERARQAAQAYADDHHALGATVARSGVIAALHQSGVERVDLTSPADDLVVGEAEAAYLTGITLTVENAA